MTRQSCQGDLCAGLVDVHEESGEWLRWPDACDQPATRSVRLTCPHAGDRRWAVCGYCAEALAERLRCRHARCLACVPIAESTQPGCPLTVVISPLAAVA